VGERKMRTFPLYFSKMLFKEWFYLFQNFPLRIKNGDEKLHWFGLADYSHDDLLLGRPFLS